MAIIPESEYPGQSNPGTSSYPQGSFRNVVVPGDGTGTPLDHNWINDLIGLLQSVTSDGLVTPNGSPDAVGNSQYLEAMRKVFGGVEDDNSGMVARDYKVGVMVSTQGELSAGDGGRAVWMIVPAGTGTADGKNYIDLANGNQAENIRLSSDNVTYAGEQLTSVIGGIVNSSESSSRAPALSKVNSQKGLNPWGMQAPINNLGDSISHGAFAGELYYNGWTRILTRIMSSDFGGLSYQGFVPMITLDSGGPNESRDIHSIGFFGTWTGQDSSSSVNGAAAYNGLTFQTVTINDRITSTIPTFQNQALVWYLQQPGGGELTVSDNTGVLSVIDTDGPLSVKSYLVALVDNGQGSAVLQAEKTDASGPPVDVMGFGYIDGTSTPVMHNFANSGRRLRYVDEQVIIDCANNSSIFMLSLGHNDQGDVDADPGGSYGLEFTQRIDWIIQHCNSNNTYLVVNDFCWTAADTSFTRLELKRAAEETNGMYISLPNLIKPDGSVPDVAYLTSTINMWVDGSHPNAEGNKWIAETIAKTLGMSIASKKDAISKNDYWMPFDIPVGTNNSFTGPASVSAYRINGGEVNFRYAVEKSPGGSFPIGTHNLQVAWRVTPPFTAVGTGLTMPGVVRGDTNVLTSSVNAEQTGSLDLVVTDGTWINDQQGIAKLAISLD